MHDYKSPKKVSIWLHCFSTRCDLLLGISDRVEGVPSRASSCHGAEGKKPMAVSPLSPRQLRKRKRLEKAWKGLKIALNWWELSCSKVMVDVCWWYVNIIYLNSSQDIGGILQYIWDVFVWAHSFSKWNSQTAQMERSQYNTFTCYMCMFIMAL